MKTVVVFQGGGALGAFGAGAWQALAQHRELRQAPLVAVAGASIGAVNAAMVAQAHAIADRGSATLTALWRERIATPSWPFLGAWPLPVPPSAADSGHWNAFMTGVLMGNRRLWFSRWPVWQPLSGLRRLDEPLHDRSAMWQLLEAECAPYRSAAHAPLLAVAAVDVMSGELRLFDSDEGELTARHLAASSALPLLFEPVQIDGRTYWDGEVTRESMLPALLQRLLQTRRVQRGEPLRLVTIEQFPRASAAMPRSGAEIAYRALNLMQLGKLEPPAIDGIHIARLDRIVREPVPQDGVSGQFDYSPRRIEQLLQEGREAATRALSAPKGRSAAARAQPPAPPPRQSISHSRA